MLTFGSLFSGIGGFDLGLERAGWTCRWQVEIDSYCQRVLNRHWPNVPKFFDVCQLMGEELERVDLVAGGFPCQSVSVAGKRRGQDDERWLWPEFVRIIRILRPRFILVENVLGLLVRGISDVLGDLAACGYDVEWESIPASAFGASHIRERVWLVAYPNCVGRIPIKIFSRSSFKKHRKPPKTWGEVGWVLSTDDSGTVWCFPDTDTVRSFDGVSDWVDRLSGVGNAVVLVIVEWIGRRIAEVSGEVP